MSEPTSPRHRRPPYPGSLFIQLDRPALKACRSNRIDIRLDRFTRPIDSYDLSHMVACLDRSGIRLTAVWSPNRYPLPEWLAFASVYARPKWPFRWERLA